MVARGGKEMGVKLSSRELNLLPRRPATRAPGPSRLCGPGTGRPHPRLARGDAAGPGPGLLAPGRWPGQRRKPEGGLMDGGSSRYLGIPAAATAIRAYRDNPWKA